MDQTSNISPGCTIGTLRLGVNKLSSDPMFTIKTKKQNTKKKLCNTNVNSHMGSDSRSLTTHKSI